MREGSHISQSTNSFYGCEILPRVSLIHITFLLMTAIRLFHQQIFKQKDTCLTILFMSSQSENMMHTHYPNKSWRN